MNTYSLSTDSSQCTPASLQSGGACVAKGTACGAAFGGSIDCLTAAVTAQGTSCVTTAVTGQVGECVTDAVTAIVTACVTSGGGTPAECQAAQGPCIQQFQTDPTDMAALAAVCEPATLQALGGCAAAGQVRSIITHVAFASVNHYLLCVCYHTLTLYSITSSLTSPGVRRRPGASVGKCDVQGVVRRSKRHGTGG
jgi:hypothetical protein